VKWRGARGEWETENGKRKTESGKRRACGVYQKAPEGRNVCRGRAQIVIYSPVRGDIGDDRRRRRRYYGPLRQRGGTGATNIPLLGSCKKRNWETGNRTPDWS
jgi:hypothetical protein